MENIKKVLMVTREYDGVAGAGGVKDVCRQLSEALVQHADCDVRVILPYYGCIDAPGLGFEPMQLACSDDGGERTVSFTVDMNYPDEDRREAVHAQLGDGLAARVEQAREEQIRHGQRKNQKAGRLGGDEVR